MEEKGKSFKPGRYLLKNIMLIVVAAVVVLFAVLKGLDIYTNHGEAIVVPDVRGIDAHTATLIFKNKHIKAVVADSTYIKDKAPGVILDMTPPAGQKVKEGRTVYLTLNRTNVPLRQVPDVSDNSSYREAEAILLAAGFKLGETEFINGEKDWVYGLKYNGNEILSDAKVPVGSTLILMVGDGLNELRTDSDSIVYYHMDQDTIQRNDNGQTIEKESWF